jgi:hypothetical protein
MRVQTGARPYNQVKIVSKMYSQPCLFIETLQQGQFYDAPDTTSIQGENSRLHTWASEARGVKNSG